MNFSMRLAGGIGLGTVFVVGLSVFGAPRAYSAPAGSFTDTVALTSAPDTNVYGYRSGAGSISPAKTLGGYTYVALYSSGIPKVGKYETIFSVSGFSASPGAGWLDGVTCGSVTFSGSAATFSFSGTTATYSWVGAYLVNPVASKNTCQLNYGGQGGTLFPKYQVVGLTYAPPGSKSTATYANGFMNGTATSNTSTWSNKLAVEVQLTTGFDLFGFLSGGATNTVSASWTQEEDSTSSLSIVQSLNTGLTVPGPPLTSSGQDQGVDHNYDIVYVWLNPGVLISLSGNAVVLSGYYYDERDGETEETCDGHTYAGITGMDVVPLTVGQLTGVTPITDGCLLERLSRPWDTATGGLTSTDFLEIAKQDPFYENPAFNPNSDTSGRYDMAKGGNLFMFVEGSPTPQSYSVGYSTTSTAGQSAKTTYSVGYSISGSVAASVVAEIASKLTITDTYTVTNQWSKTITNGTTQTNSFTIVPPAAGTYPGATEVQVWKDNVYGTYMFFPEN
jgi:hypothetical protein